MKNEIVTCIDNTHPLYDDSFKNKKIKVGKSYKCLDELTLTAPSYYIPAFASLQGITIKSHVDKYGWVKPCLPKECFRIATASERRKYFMLLIFKMPVRFTIILFFKLAHWIDRVLRRKYYEKLYEEFL